MHILLRTTSNSRVLYDLCTYDVTIHVVHRQMASSGWHETLSEENYEFEMIIINRRLSSYR